MVRSKTCSILPAPPWTTTGMLTASHTCLARSKSKPFPDPSLSTQVNNISPAPSCSTSCAQETTSLNDEFLPLSVNAL